MCIRDRRGVVENAFERDRVIANINALVDKARAEHVALVWIQHSDEQLERGSDRWRLADELHPDPSEPLVEKHYGDSFEDTELENVLADLGVGRVVVTGAQTDACIRSTLHGAFVLSLIHILGALALVVVLLGPGRFSLDALLARGFAVRPRRGESEAVDFLDR